MSPAERLLAAARKDSPDAPTGHVRSGAARVTYHRTDSHLRARAREYTVGTDAVAVAFGRASAVLPYLAAILAGNVTRADCDAWIAGQVGRVGA